MGCPAKIALYNFANISKSASIKVSCFSKIAFLILKDISNGATIEAYCVSKITLVLLRVSLNDLKNTSDKKSFGVKEYIKILLIREAFDLRAASDN